MTSRAPGSGKGSSGAAKGPGAGLNDLESGLEATVCAYLRHQPDFFSRNPDLLGDIKIAHVTGGAVSLIEHQVTVLRRQLDTEKGRLSHLITRAREYESLSNRLHALVLQIIPTRGIDGLCHAMHDAVTREFSAEAVALKLFPVDPEASIDGDPTLAAFKGFLQREHALCGPLEAERATLLFGEAGARVQSAAIMPIRAGDRSGVLAIGATDPQRFVPEVGTNLLDRLAEIVSCKLVSLPAEALLEIGSLTDAPAQTAGRSQVDDPADERTADIAGDTDASPEAQPGT